MSQLQVTKITTVDNTTPLILATGNSGGGQIIIQSANTDIMFSGNINFSNKFTGDGSGFYLPTSNVANMAYNTANAAFASANNVAPQVTPAFLTANLAYALSNIVYAASNSNWTVTNTVYGVANAAFASANNVAPQVTPAFNTANNAYLNSNAAFNAANTKFSSSGGTISGAVEITADLTVHGNTRFIDQQTLSVGDPLIYLAANNYSSDVVDIGFVANYVNATGSNVHTGLYRSSGSKEYYLFYGYDKEPLNNYIDPTGNNITMAVLNSTVRTSNLILGGANTINWITSAYASINSNWTVGNTAYTVANLAYGVANTALQNTSGTTFAGSLTITGNMITNGHVSSSAQGGNFIYPADTGYEWWTGAWNDYVSYQITRRSTSTGTGYPYFMIDTTGNVGIGTTSPSYKLDVSGTTRLGNNGVQGNPNSTDITSTAYTLLGGTGGNYLAFGQYGSGNTYAQWIQSSYQNPSTAIYNIVLQPLGGNAGIGVFNPRAKLSISDAGGTGTTGYLLHLAGSDSSTDPTRYMIGFSHGANSYPTNVRAGIGMMVTVGGNGNLIFETGSGGGQTERMRIDGVGNVGIGKSPGYKLDVSGDINISGSYRVAGTTGQIIPSGTTMTFQQTAAPTGYTKVTTYNDYAMRIVSGSVANKTTGVAFTSAFASQGVTGTLNNVTVTGSVGSTTLSESQIPSHQHVDGFAGVNGNATWGVHPGVGAGNVNGQSGQSGSNHAYTSPTGGGGSHNHSFTADAHGHTFTGTSINLAVNYVDFILATAN